METFNTYQSQYKQESGNDAVSHEDNGGTYSDEYVSWLQDKVFWERYRALMYENALIRAITGIGENNPVCDDVRAAALSSLCEIQKQFP